MSTDRNLSKKLILFIAAVLAAFLLVCISRLMAVNGIRTGSYTNPNVASSVIEGTIYDRNGKILSVTTNGERIYPYSDHALSLIKEVERVYSHVINPHPGYEEATTYGDNIYLTIDADIQYLLDKAASELKTYQKYKKVYGFVADAQTGEILALLDNSLISKVKDLRTKTVLKTVNSDSKPTEHKISSSISCDDPSFLKVFYESEIRNIENKYLVYLGTDLKSQRGIDIVIENLKSGLRSQSKL